MNQLKDDKGEPRHEADPADSEEPRLVPADCDTAEGDEEKHEETDMPPAMPPKV